MLEYTALTMLIISLDHDIELFLYIEKYVCRVPPLNHRLCQFVIEQLSQGMGLDKELMCLNFMRH